MRDSTDAVEIARRGFLRTFAGGAAAAAMLSPVSPQAPLEVDRYLSDTSNYNGRVRDLRSQREVTVRVGGEGNGGNFAFEPPAIRVDSGATVVWEWTGQGGSHNVVNEGGAFDSGSPMAEAGTTFEHTFNDEDTFLYHCGPHETLGMKGAIVVGDINQATDTGGTNDAATNDLTIDGSPPASAQVGDAISFTATVQNPFQNAPDRWTLQGRTELENASWTIQVSDEGDPVDTVDAGGEQFRYDLDRRTGATTVEITVSGNVPPRSGYSYEEMSRENVTIISIGRRSNGAENEIEAFESHRYTEESRAARNAIDDAIEAVGGTNDTVEQAISAYNSGNFGDAINLANEAEGGGEQSAGNTPQSQAESTDYNRGFFTNDPESGFTVLNNPLNLTTIGFALSIVGILLELRRGG